MCTGEPFRVISQTACVAMIHFCTFSHCLFNSGEFNIRYIRLIVCLGHVGSFSVRADVWATFKPYSQLSDILPFLLQTPSDLCVCVCMCS